MAHQESFYLKLARAKKHIDSLERSMDAFLKRYPYSVVEKANMDRTEYTWVMREPKPFPRRWGVLIGDCLHNLRSSLDHLVFAMARGHEFSGRDREMVQFPIFRGEPRTRKGGGFQEATKHTLAGVPKEACAIIESLQPYNRGNYFTIGPHPLESLSTWANADRHRAIHPIWAILGGVRISAEIAPLAFEQAPAIIEDETEIYWAQFDRPDVDVDVHVVLHLVLPLEEPLEVVPVFWLTGIHQFIRGQVVKPLLPYVRPLIQ